MGRPDCPPWGNACTCSRPPSVAHPQSIAACSCPAPKRARTECGCKCRVSLVVSEAGPTRQSYCPLISSRLDKAQFRSAMTDAQRPAAEKSPAEAGLRAKACHGGGYPRLRLVWSQPLLNPIAIPTPQSGRSAAGHAACPARRVPTASPAAAEISPLIGQHHSHTH